MRLWSLEYTYFSARTEIPALHGSSENTKFFFAALNEGLILACCSLPQLPNSKYMPANTASCNAAHNQAPVLGKLLLCVLGAKVVLTQELVVHVWVSDADKWLAQGVQGFSLPATQGEEDVFHTCEHLFSGAIVTAIAGSGY